MARACAHGVTPVAKFSDPTALALLPAEARERVERFRSGAKPRNFREGVLHSILEKRSAMMVARTVAIDEAVREAASPQVVILGAGLDGRAWRMPELRDVVVFEVDHPDSQREKQARAAALPAVARDVRFVPVDFARDNLERALADTGHDPSRPTTWIWEGVVMYLALPDIEATLRVIDRKSAPGSRLIVAYASKGPVLGLIRFLLKRAGEPMQSIFTADSMAALLSRHGYKVVRDEDAPTTAASLSPTLARESKALKHSRIAVANR